MKKIALVFLIYLLAFSFAKADNSNSSTHVFLQVYNCNNNGICEPQFGENYLGCPLECPPPESTTTPPVSGGGGIAPYTGGGSSNKDFHLPNEIIPGSITISVTEHEATISWQTYGDSLGLLSWGKTADGELGTISEIRYGPTHQVKLNDLESATRYIFKIESRDRNGNSIFTSAKSFFTLPSSSLPLNPSNFSYILTENGALLSWQNPTSDSFEEVRLLRSNKFYPTDPENGQILYEGPGESFLDNQVEAGGNYYYSLFAKNNDGSFSSGVLLHLNLREGLSGNPPLPSIGSINPTGYANTIPESSINIEQDQRSILIENGVATLIINRPFTFSFLSEEAPDNLQSFILSIEDENHPGLFHSYLLRKSPDASIFEANISGFTESGNYRFFLDTLNSGKQGSEHFAGYFHIENKPLSWFQALWYRIILYISRLLKRLHLSP